MDMQYIYWEFNLTVIIVVKSACFHFISLSLTECSLVWGQGLYVLYSGKSQWLYVGEICLLWGAWQLNWLILPYSLCLDFFWTGLILFICVYVEAK